MGYFSQLSLVIVVSFTGCCVILIYLRFHHLFVWFNACFAGGGVSSDLHHEFEHSNVIRALLKQCLMQ